MQKIKITNKEFKNKRVFFDYEIIEKYEAGIVLQGTEVKSLRDGKISILDFKRSTSLLSVWSFCL